jgi:hypothetical protein
MWIGSCRQNNDKPLPVNWATSVNILGIHFTYDEVLMTSLNYTEKLKSLNQLIALWKQRNLTALGRIVIMKTFGISKFLYISSIIGMPDTIQKKINAVIYSFIWNGPDKVKRAVLNASYSDGGLKMINLSARIRAQKMMWVKRFMSPINAGWKDMLCHYVCKVGGSSFFLCNFDMSKVVLDISPFYRDVLALWGSLIKTTPEDITSIMNQRIFNNQYILVGHKSVY